MTRPKRMAWRAWGRALGGLLAPLWRVGALLAVVAALAGLAALYQSTRHTVHVQLDGHTYPWRTHKRTPEAVLAELPVTLLVQDRAYLPTTDEMLAGAPLRLDLAQRVRVAHDGSLTVVDTQAETVGALLRALGITLGPQDCAAIEGYCVPTTRPLVEPAEGATLLEAVATWRRPIDVAIRRARQITVVDGVLPADLYTTATTVGEALGDLGLTVYEGDLVYPDLGAAIAPGLRITIARSLPVSIEADGQAWRLRSRVDTVGELLAEAGLTLSGDDYVTPGVAEALAGGVHIRVVRVYEEYYVEEVPVPYETRWEPNPELEIDLQQTVQWGTEGARRRQVRVHYENGQETQRSEEAEWIAREPTDRVIEYGTKIVVRELQTGSGTVTYWRKLRMYATSYNAPTAGVSPSSPSYGHTKLGWRAAFGIVAVDPSVIALGSKVYVPGYGTAAAGDTGGGVKGKRIDLCYDDNNLVHWSKWVDVYLLTPVPPASQINWIVPNTPKERE
ncbi:MAG: ubiquitin-like domain-containing protein [Anaerolineales bacterium]